MVFYKSRDESGPVFTKGTRTRRSDVEAKRSLSCHSSGADLMQRGRSCLKELITKTTEIKHQICMKLTANVHLNAVHGADLCVNI